MPADAKPDEELKIKALDEVRGMHLCALPPPFGQHARMHVCAGPWACSSSSSHPNSS